jgi:hypothetical protein
MHRAVFCRNGWQQSRAPWTDSSCLFSISRGSRRHLGLNPESLRVIPNFFATNPAIHSAYRGNGRRASLQKPRRAASSDSCSRHQILRNELYPEIYLNTSSYAFYFDCSARVLSSGAFQTRAPTRACTPAASVRLINFPRSALFRSSCAFKTTRSCTRFPVSSNTVWRAQKFPASPCRPWCTLPDPAARCNHFTSAQATLSRSGIAPE